MKRSLSSITFLIAAAPAAVQNYSDGQGVFSHDASDTCIPTEPQRIVTLVQRVRSYIARVPGRAAE